MLKVIKINNQFLILKLPFDYCQMVDFFFAIYLFIMIIAHLWIPHKESLNKHTHSVLITIYIAAAADIFDFSEYNNDHLIASIPVDVHQCINKF